MRYGVTFADGDPFPQDATIGIQLADEEAAAPIVVPAECPPSTCEPDFKYWYVTGIAHIRTGGSEGAPVSQAFVSLVMLSQLGFAQETGDTIEADIVTGSGYVSDYDHTKEAIFQVVPFFEPCEHYVRLTVNCGDSGFSVFGSSEPFGTTLFGNSLIELPGGGPAADLLLLFFFGTPYGVSAISSSPHRTIEIKMQIDLTDNHSSPTWTDFGPTLHLNNFT
jgi:hypothetical protein